VIARACCTIAVLGSFGVSGCVPNDSKPSADAQVRPTAESRTAQRRIPQRLKPTPLEPPQPPNPAPADPRPADPRSQDMAGSAALVGDAAMPSKSGARLPPAPAIAQPEQAILRRPFSDSFDRTELGPDWRTTSPAWQLRAGQVCVSGARNHPLWLVHRIPTNARIEFDVASTSSDGDIKAEFWGDGKSSATSVSYTNASSYLTIFGGWRNSFHVLARLDEHAPDRLEIKLQKESADLRAQLVRPNHTYHFKVERNDGKTIRWLVDDIEILNLADPKPLKGKGHDHFGFNDWEVPLCFDNLKVTPLDGE
jgi:hypothetical protein